jgi:hypothetical protein
MVTMKDQQRILTFKCNTCQHEWDVTNPTTAEGWPSVGVTIERS